jgi:hypothetical protein
MWWLLTIPAFFVVRGIAKSVARSKAPSFIDEKVSTFRDSLALAPSSSIHDYNREMLYTALELARETEDRQREKTVLALLSSEK